MAGADEPWHLDKKVPITLIIAIVAQTGAAFWWASGVESRLHQAALENTSQDDDIGELQSDAQALAVTAATVNAQLLGLSESINELKVAQRETNELLRQLGNRSP